MSGMVLLSESDRIMAEADALVAEAAQGMAPFRQALAKLAPDARITAMAVAALGRRAPAWLAPPPIAAAACTQGKAVAPLQLNDTRRVRKHRFMV